MPKVPVVLIEENYFLREGIAARLRNHGIFEVIEWKEGRDALGKVNTAKSTPPVVLLNPGVEDGRGLKRMALLREELPEAKAIVMDITPSSADVVEFVKAGAWGFIMKDAPEEDYFKTIETVAEGFKVLPPGLTGALFTQIVRSALEGDGVQNDLPKLTRREREIVDLISEGLSNKEIAARIHIATFTVKSHIHNILEKLALNSRLQIAAFARNEATGELGARQVSCSGGHP